MKVSVWHHPEPVELEVDVSLDDIRNTLASLPAAESGREAGRIVQTCSVPLRAIPDAVIANTTPEFRKTIADFFSDQAARWKRGDS